MKIQVILSSIVIGVLFYFVYLLSLVKGFDWALYETEIAVALTVIAISVGYWGFKPILQKAGIKISVYDEKLGEKYDAKKLNQTVFKKLMRLECLESLVFSEDRFVFCIPINTKAFGNKANSDYRQWFVDSRDPSSFQYEFDIIERVVPSLEIGEQYLQKNYNDIYKQWTRIKQSQ